MKIENSNLSKIINETKLEVINFKDALTDKKNELPDINEIKRQLSIIEKIIKDVRGLCTSECNIMSEQAEKLSTEALLELINKTDIMYEVISQNLPNGIMLVPYEENKKKFATLVTTDTKLIAGIIKTNEKEGKLNLEIKLEGSEKIFFEIESPLRMISIASYLNMKLNYE